MEERRDNELTLSSDEEALIDKAAADIMDTYRAAFEELAK